MADITDSVYFLVECDFNGLIKRYAEKDIDVSSKHFDGKIMSIGLPGTSFNLRTFSHSMSSVSVEITNEDRLQDEEVRRVLDGSLCKVYIYSEGMTWTEVEAKGLIHTGVFKKNFNCSRRYSFTIEDATRRRMRSMPEAYINEDNFGVHRTAGGGGSVSGKAVPVIFGDFDSGVPLLCTHTSDFKYAAALGVSKSLDSEYTATTENVYDKDGAVIAAAGYTFYPSGLMASGPYAYFDFTADQVDSENLSCSFRGIKDTAGLITETANELIEHPAHIFHYIVNRYGINIDPDEESIGTMKALLPGLRMAVYINDVSNAADVLSQRILRQCLCSLIINNGRYGVVTFDVSGSVTGRFTKKHHHIGGSIQIAKTDIENVCNSLTINYALNVATGKYEEQLTVDRTTNALCRDSYYQYGERPEVVLTLPDIRTENDAKLIAKRYVSVHAFRHDIAPILMSYSDGYTIKEGDAALWTIPEGASSDGNGWAEKRCILLDRAFTRQGIQQRWWNADNSSFASGVAGGGASGSGESGKGIKDTAGDIIKDTAGDNIQDTT